MSLHSLELKDGFGRILLHLLAESLLVDGPVQEESDGLVLQEIALKSISNPLDSQSQEVLNRYEGMWLMRRSMN